jgi:ABC-type phosphate/phosphonate transport system substrate-binding protein
VIAALPMYDRPEARHATDRFWQAIRTALGEGPARLTRDRDPWQIWTDPDLLLAQTCGLPYRTRLHGRVHLVGTPDHGLPGCPPGHYNSVLVTRPGAPRDFAAFRGRRLAVNDLGSQSGWAAPQQHAARHGFAFADPLITGAHAASARAVAEGRADIAAIDAQSWRMIRAHDPRAGDLAELARTAPTPALPYITAFAERAAPLAAAIRTAIGGLAPQDAACLGLRGLCTIPASAYLAVPTPAPARAECD